MLSFDVKFPFTNVPTQRPLDCLKKKLREFHYSSNEIEEYLNLAHFGISQTAFVFNGVFHSNIEGLGIGSALSPLLSF